MIQKVEFMSNYTKDYIQKRASFQILLMLIQLILNLAENGV